MSKQRKWIPHILGDDPALDHAAALVEEYNRKLRIVCRRLHDIRAKYIDELEKRRQQLGQSDSKPTTQSSEELIWHEVGDTFRSRHAACAEYLRAIIPHSVKLAQHVSQLITHGSKRTIVQIELGLRVAELESAIKTAKSLAGTQLHSLPLA